MTDRETRNTERSEEERILQDFASTLLDFLASHHQPASSVSRRRRFARAAAVTTCISTFADSVGPSLFFFRGHHDIDGILEYLVHATHLLAAALNIGSTHAVSNCSTLFRCYRGQSLGLEEFNARPLRTQVRLEPNEDDWRGGTEVKNLGVPLSDNVRSLARRMWGVRCKDAYLIHNILQ